MTRRYRSALVAALACASLFAAGLASEAAAKRGGAKSAPAATAKAAGKAAKPSGKKVAAGKSKRGKSTKEAVSQKSVVPQIPLAQGPAPQTPDAEIALEALRKGGASKATDVAAAISDPAARKLVEWIILRSDHNGANSKRFLAFIAANPNWPNLAMFRRRAEAMLWVEHVKPAQALAFFDGSPPQSGMGRLVLARARWCARHGATTRCPPMSRSRCSSAIPSFSAAPITRRAWRSDLPPWTMKTRCGPRAG